VADFLLGTVFVAVILTPFVAGSILRSRMRKGDRSPIR
jgi:hypothetical protein